MVNVKGLATGVILLIVAIIVIFQLIAGTSTELTSAADNISSSGLPLAGLFGSSGIVIMIVMVGVLLAVIGIAFKLGKK